MTKLTSFQIKALKVIREHGPIRPREFAKHMWPNSDGWRRSMTVGRNANGSVRGAGMCLAGGGYLGKLAQKNFVRRKWSFIISGYFLGYELTLEGQKILDEHP